MAKQFAVLQCIDNNEGITQENHYEFLYHLQNTLLLALREQGRLNTMQHRHAEEKLKKQRRDRAQNILKKGRACD